MNIQLAETKDKAGIARYDRHIPQERLDDCIRGGQVYVLKDRDAVVGILRFGFFWQTMPFLELIYLDESYRGRGFGTEMMRRWEEDMSRAGHKYLMTSTQADETAWRFYEKLGYKMSGSFLPPEQDFQELMYVKTVAAEPHTEEYVENCNDQKHQVLK